MKDNLILFFKKAMLVLLRACANFKNLSFAVVNDLFKGL